jgi:predicted transcriptional regulator
MTVLWEKRAATVAEVVAALGARRAVNYSTVQTMLRILENKGYVAHERSGQAFLYRPLVDQRQARRSALSHLTSRLFNDSPSLLCSTCWKTNGSIRQNSNGSSNSSEKLSRRTRGRAIELALARMCGHACRDRHSARSRVQRGHTVHLWWTTMLLVLLLPMAPTLLMPGGQELAGVVTSGSPPALTVSIGVARLARCCRYHTLECMGGGIAGASRRRSSACAAQNARVDYFRLSARRLRSWLSVRTSGRPASIVISHEVRWAAVLGLRSPVIAVAPALLYELNDQELDQVLVHEWAHVQRRDDAACLVQVLIHAVAGLHPAAWWINRRLKVEREAACDDWAVRVTGSSKGFASCLTRLAALNGRSRDAILVPGALSGSALTTRVVRLLDRRRNASPQRSATALALITPVLVGLVLLAASVKLVMIAMPMTRLSDARPSVPAGMAELATQAPRQRTPARVHAMRRSPTPARLPREVRCRDSLPRRRLDWSPLSAECIGRCRERPSPEDLPHPAVAALTDLLVTMWHLTARGRSAGRNRKN